MTVKTTDKIEKEIIMRAPRSKVWRALTNAEEFGKWFGVKMHDSFVPGAIARGKILSPGYDHLTLEVHVDRIEAEHLFSYRWHPYAVDPEMDYSNEPTTLVSFELEEIAEGTRLKVTESGFDRIPLARRDEAFRMNSGGWAAQVENVANYVDAES
jgi:uncharacterized protein YndB with AHSA1/START domain